MQVNLIEFHLSKNNISQRGRHIFKVIYGLFKNTL